MEKAKSARFGEINYDPNKIIRFADGLIGFSGLNNFVLLPHKEDSPFSWLHSIDDPDVAFVVLAAHEFFPDYAPDIPDGEIADLEIEKTDDVILLSLVSIPEKVEEMTANLMAPIMINKKTLQAKQVIITNSEKYGVKEKIIREVQV